MRISAPASLPVSPAWAQVWRASLFRALSLVTLRVGLRASEEPEPRSRRRPSLSSLLLGPAFLLRLRRVRQRRPWPRVPVLALAEVAAEVAQTASRTSASRCASAAFHPGAA